MVKWQRHQLDRPLGNGGVGRSVVTPHDDVIVEIETAKSLVELPSPYEGTVLALLVAPFTKLVHIALMPATQYVSEVGWHFVPDAGEKVAKALGKENQPI